MVRCTLYRHCHHFHCHYQKCPCQIYLLRCPRRNGHAILYYLATCILQQMLKFVTGTMLVVVVIVVVVVMVVVFFRYIRNSASLVIFVLRVYKFIWKLFTKVSGPWNACIDNIGFLFLSVILCSGILWCFFREIYNRFRKVDL